MDKSDTTLRHPIGVVSRRTGLTQDLIRAWERRYGVVASGRTETGRRLYTDEDVRRLLLLRRLVDGGRRISDVARLKLVELEALVEEDVEAAATETVRPPVDGRAYLEAALDATARLDPAGLERVLTDATLSMSPTEVRQKFLTPLLVEMGERWRAGTLRIAHEHLTTGIVRVFVDGMRKRSGKVNGRPNILITTTSGQMHELGALMAAAAAEEVGWDAIYLGTGLPAEEIGAAARQSKARAVGLSLVFGDDAHVADELRAIRRYLSDGAELIVGGRATTNLDGVIEEIGAHRVTDLMEFQSMLDTLRNGTEKR